MLTGEQWRQLSDALNEAFPTYDYLQVFVREELGLALADISEPKALPFVLFELLQYAEAHSIVIDLVETARHNRPKDLRLFVLAQELGLAPATDNLERLLNKQNIVFDITAFRIAVAAIEARVCRVELQGAAAGTGFLIGPSAVMTNYHVVEDVVSGEELRLRFDYKLLEDGSTVHDGILHTLAEDWLIDSSPPSKVDFLPEPKPSDPGENELDYAVLRTKEHVAGDALGKLRLPGFDAERGYISLSPAEPAYEFEANKVLFIAQHPHGKPLKLTANTFRGRNGNGTRVTYHNDTEPGSSGSPCFSANWELVALHHSGDPAKLRPQFNEGIPIHAIVNLLQARGKLPEIAQGA